jgi:hypothetical protein
MRSAQRRSVATKKLQGAKSISLSGELIGYITKKIVDHTG